MEFSLLRNTPYYPERFQKSSVFGQFRIFDVFSYTIALHLKSLGGNAVRVQVPSRVPGLPAEISESAYNLFVKGAAPDSTTLAKDLYNAAENNNYSSALSNLKKLRNTDDYSEVSTKFKEYRIDGGVRKTLVTGMLDTFKTTSQQDAIRMEFLRMGLKYDGSKWSVPTSFNFFSAVKIYEKH